MCTEHGSDPTIAVKDAGERNGAMSKIDRGEIVDLYV
jgi:hypothetical protein